MRDRLDAPRSPFSISLACLALTALCVVGCATQTPFVWAKEAPAPAREPLSSKIGPGDKLTVTIQSQETSSDPQIVGIDGYLNIPLIGPVLANGKTVEQLGADIQEKLKTMIAEPRVGVVLVEKMVQVSVLGEVQRPGKYPIGQQEGITTALALAGGVTEFADEDAIYLVRSAPPRLRFRLRELTADGQLAAKFKLRDGDLVVVE